MESDKTTRIPQLKLRIVEAFEEITVKMRQKTLLEFKKRLKNVIENEGVAVVEAITRETLQAH